MSSPTLKPPIRKSESPVGIHLAGDKAYVYDVDDIRKLRVDHHITGITLGTLPQVSQQNVFLGVPLQLLPEEVAVLISERLAILIDDKIAHATPTVQQANDYALQRETNIRAQQQESLQAEEEKNRVMRDKYKNQIEKRKQEKEALRKAKDVESSSVADSNGNSEIQGLLQQDDANATPAQTSNAPPPSSSETNASTVNKRVVTDVPYSIVNSTASTGNAWYIPSPLAEKIDPTFLDSSRLLSKHISRARFSLLDHHTHIGTVLPVSPLQGALNEITKIGQGSLAATSWADGSAMLASPTGDIEAVKLKEARIQVFKDLWGKGYFLGSGLKFGGDFLVYPGDPLRFHSHFVCTVLKSPLADIPPLDIVAWGRLATAVKKAHLIASWDEKTGKVEYLSLEWAGFG